MRLPEGLGHKEGDLCRHGSQRASALDGGFTLIEILAVLVIVGVMLSVAVIRVGGDGEERVLRDEARRLSAVTRLVAEKAILDSREFGLWISPAGYRVLVFSKDGWRPASADPVFRERVWPAWLRIQFVVEGERVTLVGADDPGDSPPQISILSSGEITPFQIALTNAEGTIHAGVVGDDNGVVAVQ